MENASKALLIAGALLIAILLITIGIAIYNSAGGILNQGRTALTGQELMMFNQKFTAYEGIISGTSLRALVDVVNSNNADKTSNPPVTIAGEGVKQGTEKDGYISNYECTANSLQKYNAEITKDTDSGQVRSISVTKAK